MIEVEHLRKEFIYHKKMTGLRGSIKNFFHRETLKKEAVSDISFSVKKGEMVGFLGPNGAGKTTTLKMLSGILYPTGGKVSVDGFVPWERKNEFKRKISIVMGQKNQLWWDLPASDSFYLNKCMFGVKDGDYRDIITELSELLEVKDLLNVQVRRLSLGERMKMEIMAALIHKPDILFLDEPTIGLDIISAQKIREFLKLCNEKWEMTVMITSHYMADIEALCERALIINQGTLVYDGKLLEMNELFGKRKLLSIKTPMKKGEEFWKEFGLIREITSVGVTLEVLQESVKEVLSALLSNLEVEDFTVTEIPIEESITRFYKKEVVML